MRLASSFLTVALLMSTKGVVGADKPPGHEDHSRLMVYCDDQGQEHPVQTKDDWAIRRRHILAGMEAAMGPLPDRSKWPPLDMQVKEQVEGDGFVRQTITIEVEANDRLPAYLYRPKGLTAGKRVAAVLALHPTSDLGKGVVAGLGKANRAYALELAERGYVVLAPDYPSFGDYKYDFAASTYASGTMKGIVNHMRCVDLLQSLPEVDPERIGVIGHSLGGHNAMFVAVFDARLKVVVASCGWTPFHEYYRGNLTGWTSARYMPRLKDAYGLDPDRVPFDFEEVVAALAPCPFFSNSPLKDDNFAVTGVKKAVAKSEEVYRLFGVADHLIVRYPDCGHDFSPEVRREAYDLMDTILKHTPIRTVP
jgi:acetyl esterase/lipase